MYIVQYSQSDYGLDFSRTYKCNFLLEIGKKTQVRRGLGQFDTVGIQRVQSCINDDREP